MGVHLDGRRGSLHADGLTIGPATVWKWVDTGKVTSCCRWSAGVRWGQILVFWPDVAERSALLVEKHLRVEEERRVRAEQARRFYAVLASREITKRAAALQLGKSMGLHPNRVRAFLGELEKAHVATPGKAS